MWKAKFKDAFLTLFDDLLFVLLAIAFVYVFYWVVTEQPWKAALQVHRQA